MIAESYPEKGKIKQRIVGALGDKKELKKKGEIAKGILRYCKERES